MRRSSLSKQIGFFLLVGLLVSLSTPMAASASKPGRNCPASASDYVDVDADGWWAGTVDGIEKGGLNLEEVAEVLGYASLAEMEAGIKASIISTFDKNGNGIICMGDLPNTPGNPAYLFRAIDDNSSTKN